MMSETTHAHDHDHRIHVPRAALIAAASLIVVSIVTAGVARVSGWGRSSLPTAVAVETRALLFEDRADGAVVVRDAKADAVVNVIMPGTFGFVRVAMRGMARDRMLHGVDASAPFNLTRWSDHRVTVDDPTTGRRLDLAAFGRPNAEAFERLLPAPKETGK